MKKKILSMLCVLGLLMCLMPAAAWADEGTGGPEGQTFGWACDTQRDPAFPTSGQTVRAYTFKYPIGADGQRMDGYTGQWALSRVGTYSYVSSIGKATDYLTNIVNAVASNYITVNKDNIVVHELKNGNTHIAYGVVVAYDATKQRVLFIGDKLAGGAGYLFSTSELTDSVSITATQIATDFVPTCSISLDQTTAYTFASETAGYTEAPAAKTITVTNTGNTATGALNVTLSGKNAGSFTLGNVDDTFKAGIANGAADTFTVAPKTGLTAGTYTAKVTVSGENVKSQSFDISFTVNAADVHKHSWKYEGSGVDGIKATCTADGCDNTEGGTVKVVAPTGTLIYDGMAKKATLSGSFVSGETLTIEYLRKVEGIRYDVLANGNPTNAGVYRAVIKKDNGEGHIDYTIAQAGARTLADIAVSRNSDVTGEQSQQIGSIMPNDAGTLGYTEGTATVSGNAAVSGFAVDSNGLVKYTITGGVAGDVITLPVVISSTNYADSTVKVVVTLAAANVSTGGGGGSHRATSYAIVVENTKNGEVAVSDTAATKGTTVTVQATPDKGYALESLVATDKSGNEIKLTKVSDGKYTFTMPASKVTVVPVFAASQVEEEPTKEPEIFTDVPADAYCYNAVKWAVENGITEGLGAGKFGPDVACTRAQMVAFLWRAVGSPEPTAAECPFVDVDLNSYYGKAVLWALEKGITNGNSDTEFAPDMACTRAQMVTFICRLADGQPVGGATGFGDVAAESYYAAAIQWAVEQGITNGVEEGKFAPDGTCTRGAMVTFLYRYFAK